MFKKIVNRSVLFGLVLACGLVQASGNTIYGEISILKKDGTPKNYRANVVVFLEHVGSGLSYQAPTEAIVISQRGRRFRPPVLPVIKGTEVAFPNDDKVLHNVFSLSKTKPFDLGNYKKGESRSVTFDTPGRVKIYCNIHPKMELDVLVLNNPYFAKTKQDGTFEIEGVPDGDYTLRVWHELSEEVSKQVTLAGGDIQQHGFEITLTKTRAKHKNKYGKPYRGKY